MQWQFHRLLLGIAVLAAFVTFFPLCCGQVPASRMDNRWSSFQEDRRLTSVAIGNGIIVAVGFNRGIFTSKDGTNWFERSESPEVSTVGINFTTEIYAAGGHSFTLIIPNEGDAPKEVHQNPFQFRKVGFGRDKFVIVGDSGEIYYSANGENWLPARTSTHANLNGVTSGGGKFVTVGDGGAILSSPDAVNWTQHNSGTSNQLRAVAYGNKTFVAVGGDMDNSVILTSEDGAIWTPHHLNYQCPMQTIAFGNGEFMVSAGNGYQLSMMSADGKAWREVVHPSSTVRSLTFGGGRFIAADYSQRLVVSSDGKKWTRSFSEPEHSLGFYDVAYGDGMYAAVGVNWAGVSHDGIHWSAVALPRLKFFQGHIDGGQFFVPDYQPSAGHSFRSILLHRISKDGQKWHPQLGRTTSVSGNVADGQTVFLTGKKSEENAVLYSEDGIIWTRLRPKSTLPATEAPKTSQTLAPAISSVGIEFQLNGKPYQLNLSAQVGRIYELQASTDLEHWETLATLANNSETFSFVDQDAAKYPQRFYRLKLQP